MFEPFCKLFETEDHGQILVTLESDEEGIPKLRFATQPEGLGVCSTAVTFSDSDDGWDRAERNLREMTLDKAVAALAPVFQLAK